MATPGSFLSPSHQPERRSPLPWIVAGVVVIVGLAAFWVMGHRQQSATQSAAVSERPDAYAAQLVLSNLQMSAASNFAGSQITYVDGTITNKGDRTVTGVNVVVTFQSAGGAEPVQRAMPLMLIRTRDPYVDIEPVSADPLKPGASYDFRLIFDSVPPMWDQKHPMIQPTRVTTQ